MAFDILTVDLLFMFCVEKILGWLPDNSIGWFLLLYAKKHVFLDRLIKNTQFNIAGMYDVPI